MIEFYPMASKQPGTLAIKTITPIDFFELVIQFTNLNYRLFTPEETNLYKQFPFLAYPNKLKSFVYNQDQITWFNKVSFDVKFLYSHSIAVSVGDLVNKTLRIGLKNQAPTNQHKSHHVYDVSIQPFNSQKPFILSESIGGGHGEMGGSHYFSLNELSQYPNWEKHFELAGCEWAISLIKEKTDNLGSLLDVLVLEVCKRSVV